MRPLHTPLSPKGFVCKEPQAKPFSLFIAPYLRKMPYLCTRFAPETPKTPETLETPETLDYPDYPDYPPPQPQPHANSSTIRFGRRAG